MSNRIVKRQFSMQKDVNILALKGFGYRVCYMCPCGVVECCVECESSYKGIIVEYVFGNCSVVCFVNSYKQLTDFLLLHKLQS